MRRVQLSGAQKRKRAKENEQKNLSVVAKTGKLTDFFLQTAEKDDPDQNQCQSSETASESIYLLHQKQAVLVEGQIFMMTLHMMKCHNLDLVLRQDV